MCVVKLTNIDVQTNQVYVDVQTNQVYVDVQTNQVYVDGVNATFNNISVLSWRSVLVVEETGVPIENHRQNLSHYVVSSTPRHERGSNSQL